MSFPADYNRRVKVSVTHTKVSGTGSHTDFVWMMTEVNLPAEMFDADGSFPAQNGGGDIVVTSDFAGTTRLDIDVINFVTDNDPANGEAEIAVELPSLSTSVDTDVWVWYNSDVTESQPAVGAAFGRNATYGIDKARWRLRDAGATESNLTGNTDYDGTKSGTIIQDTTNAAYGDASAGFGGAGEYALANDPFAGLTAFTIRGWLRSTAGTSDGVIGNWNSDTDMSLLVFAGSSKKLFLRLRNTGGTVATLISTTLIEGQTGTPWFFFSCRYDGSNFFLDIDGVNEASASFTGTIDTATSAWQEIGRYNHASAQRWADNLQGIALADSDLGLDWLITEYNNQNDPASFATAGTPEDAGGGSVSLSALEASHTLTSPSGLFSQNHGWFTDITAHSQSAEKAVFTGNHDFTASSAGHFQESDDATFATGLVITILDGRHGMLVSVGTFTQMQQWTGLDSFSNAESDQSAFDQSHNLILNDCLLGQFAETAGITDGGILLPGTRVLPVAAASCRLMPSSRANSTTFKPTP